MLNYLQESKATSVVDEATREIDGYVRGVKENPKADHDNNAIRSGIYNLLKQAGCSQK